MPNDTKIQPSVSGAALVYGFVYVVLSAYYTKQERPGDTKGGGFIWAWAILSYFCTAAVMLIESALMLAELPTLGSLIVPESFPTIVRYGWSYPVFLVINFRAFLSGSEYGKQVWQQYSALRSKTKTYWKASVAVCLIMLFVVSNYFVYLSV